MSDNTSTTTDAAESSKSTIVVTPRALTKNGITLTPVQTELKRGDNAGLKLAHLSAPVFYLADGKTVDEERTLAGITELIKFKGIARVAKEMTSAEKADANAVLNDSKVSETVDAKKPNKEGVLYDCKVIVSVNEDEYYNQYTSDVVRSGTNITTLTEELEDLNKEVRDLFVAMSNKQKAGDAAGAGEIQNQIMLNIAEIQQREEAIAAKRRGPRSEQGKAA